MLRHGYSADVPPCDVLTRPAARTNTVLLGLYAKNSQMQRVFAADSRCMRSDISWDYVKANARPLRFRVRVAAPGADQRLQMTPKCSKIGTLSKNAADNGQCSSTRRSQSYKLG